MPPSQRNSLHREFRAIGWPIPQSSLWEVTRTDVTSTVIGRKIGHRAIGRISLKTQPRAGIFPPTDSCANTTGGDGFVSRKKTG